MTERAASKKRLDSVWKLRQSGPPFPGSEKSIPELSPIILHPPTYFKKETLKFYCFSLMDRVSLDYSCKFNAIFGCFSVDDIVKSYFLLLLRRSRFICSKFWVFARINRFMATNKLDAAASRISAKLVWLFCASHVFVFRNLNSAKLFEIFNWPNRA